MIPSNNNFTVVFLFQIDWKLILDTLFAGLDFTFSPDEVIVVKEVDFLPELVKLLDSTPLRVIGKL